MFYSWSSLVGLFVQKKQQKEVIEDANKAITQLDEMKIMVQESTDKLEKMGIMIQESTDKLDEMGIMIQEDTAKLKEIITITKHMSWNVICIVIILSGFVILKTYYKKK